MLREQIRNSGILRTSDALQQEQHQNGHSTSEKTASTKW